MATEKSRQGRGRPPSLTRAQMMATALSIADEEGLGALTIRGVARSCGVTPMAIYRHVTTVEGLEELAFREAMRGMPEPDLTGDWSARVKSIWITFRTMLLAHPGAAAVFAKRPMPTPEIVAATNQLLVVLEEAGFSGDDVFEIYDTTFIFTLGSIRFELTRPPDARSALVDSPAPNEDRSALDRYAEQLGARDPEQQFERGLDIILRGFR